jgi:UrcA family protein
MRIHIKLILAAALLASPFTATAQSADKDQFTYYASELNSEDSAMILHDRIQLFAKDACDADFPRGHALRPTVDFKRCAKRVVKKLVREIDHPTLYDIHTRTDPQT